MNLLGLLNALRRVKHGSRRAFARHSYAFGVRLVWKLTGGRVYQGPFRGVRLSKANVFGAPAAKILGTYEQELHEPLKGIRETNPRIVVNVGGAEGYYAIGIARAWDVERLIVFETLTTGRRIIGDNAEQNGIGGAVEIHGECGEADLFDILLSRSIDFLVMDVEGAELDLLSARVLPLLSHSFLLIESHDFVRRGCTKILVDRLSKTHKLRLVESRDRLCSDFPLRALLPCKLKTRLLDERRPEKMIWLVGNPRSNVLPAN